MSRTIPRLRCGLPLSHLSVSTELECNVNTSLRRYRLDSRPVTLNLEMFTVASSPFLAIPYYHFFICITLSFELSTLVTFPISQVLRYSRRTYSQHCSSNKVERMMSGVPCFFFFYGLQPERYTTAFIG